MLVVPTTAGDRKAEIEGLLSLEDHVGCLGSQVPYLIFTFVDTAFLAAYFLSYLLTYYQPNGLLQRRRK